MADCENEWEETLVVAELSGFGDSDILKQNQLNCQVLGIDSESPVLQLDNYMFTGKYEDAIGTPLIFKGTPTEPGNPESPLSQLEYLCMTRKKLVMKRAFLQNKSIPESFTVILHDESGDEVEVCPSTSKTTAETTKAAETTAEPTTVQTAAEPAIAGEPVAVEISAGSMEVETTAESVTVESSTEQTVVAASAEPTLEQSVTAGSVPPSTSNVT